jgi:hypothetical protein
LVSESKINCWPFCGSGISTSVRPASVLDPPPPPLPEPYWLRSMKSACQTPSM